MSMRASVAKFLARNYRTEGQTLSFLDQNYRILNFVRYFSQISKNLHGKKMVCPTQIIVFQKLRSFFTFSGPK